MLQQQNYWPTSHYLATKKLLMRYKTIGWPQNYWPATKLSAGNNILVSHKKFYSEIFCPATKLVASYKTIGR